LASDQGQQSQSRDDQEFERVYAEKRVPLERAAAVADFLQKKPYNRDQLLNFLKLGSGRQGFSFARPDTSWVMSPDGPGFLNLPLQ